MLPLILIFTIFCKLSSTSTLVCFSSSLYSASKNCINDSNLVLLLILYLELFISETNLLQQQVMELGKTYNQVTVLKLPNLHQVARI